METPAGNARILTKARSSTDWTGLFAARPPPNRRFPAIDFGAAFSYNQKKEAETWGFNGTAKVRTENDE